MNQMGDQFSHSATLKMAVHFKITTFKGALCSFGGEIIDWFFILMPIWTKWMNSLCFRDWINCFTLFTYGGPCHLSGSNTVLGTHFLACLFSYRKQIVFLGIITSYCKYQNSDFEFLHTAPLNPCILGLLVGFMTPLTEGQPKPCTPSPCRLGVSPQTQLSISAAVINCSLRLLPPPPHPPPNSWRRRRRRRVSVSVSGGVIKNPD